MRCWLLACLPPHLATKLVTGRSRWPRRFLAGTAWICGARVRVTGDRPGRTPCSSPTTAAGSTSWSWPGRPAARSFPRSELGNPVVHWLADQNHTLYVRREDRRGARDQARPSPGKARRPPAGRLVSRGHHRPRRPAAAVPPDPARRGRPRRRRTSPSGRWRSIMAQRPREVGWHGESGKDNVLRMLGRRGTMPVTVRLLDPLPPSADRKALSAQRARRSRRRWLQVDARLTYRPRQ